MSKVLMTSSVPSDKYNQLLGEYKAGGLWSGRMLYNNEAAGMVLYYQESTESLGQVMVQGGRWIIASATDMTCVYAECPGDMQYPPVVGWGPPASTERWFVTLNPSGHLPDATPPAVVTNAGVVTKPMQVAEHVVPPWRSLQRARPWLSP